jgi:cell division protein ZapE
MDLFFEAADVALKRRIHFHAFMQEAHQRIHLWKRAHPGEADPIPPLADTIAAEALLLCFDEFQVHDISDAMILGRLFDALFGRNVVVCITSNRRPDQLYKDGINRPLFIPFIDRIVQNCRVVELAGGRDWRLDRMKASRVWFDGHEGGRREGFEQLWSDLRGGMPEDPTHLTVLGRDVAVQRTAGGLARATFAELCDRPLGPQDYLAVAERFHTLFIEDIPLLTPAHRQAAKRFVTLIDALYEARTRLVALAAGAPEQLYPAGDGAFEFERTVSRLNEMQSADWLDQAEKPDT